MTVVHNFYYFYFIVTTQITDDYCIRDLSRCFSTSHQFTARGTHKMGTMEFTVPFGARRCFLCQLWIKRCLVKWSKCCSSSIKYVWLGSYKCKQSNTSGVLSIPMFGVKINLRKTCGWNPQNQCQLPGGSNCNTRTNPVKIQQVPGKCAGFKRGAPSKPSCVFRNCWYIYIWKTWLSHPYQCFLECLGSHWRRALPKPMPAPHKYLSLALCQTTKAFADYHLGSTLFGIFLGVAR